MECRAVGSRAMSDGLAVINTTEENVIYPGCLATVDVEYSSSHDVQHSANLFPMLLLVLLVMLRRFLLLMLLPVLRRGLALFAAASHMG